MVGRNWKYRSVVFPSLQMNASGLIVEASQTESSQINRLSTIRESLDVLGTTSILMTQEERTLLESEGSTPITISSGRFRRPGKLDLPGMRPLSPISSSNETTPSDSPALAQRVRRIPIPPFTGFRKTLSISNQVAITPTPSPSELRPIYEAESPDELALVHAAYAYSAKLLKRTPDHVRVALPGKEI